MKKNAIYVKYCDWGSDGVTPTVLGSLTFINKYIPAHLFMKI